MVYHLWQDRMLVSGTGLPNKADMFFLARSLYIDSECASSQNQHGTVSSPSKQTLTQVSYLLCLTSSVAEEPGARPATPLLSFIHIICQKGFWEGR